MSSDQQCVGPKPGRSIIKILKKLAHGNEPVTIIIRSGSNCCELTGCILQVTDEYIVLLNENNACGRTYILLDCICAIMDPAVDNG